MMKMIKIMMMTMIMSTLMMSMCKMISKKSKMNKEKMTPFECGLSPKSSARSPFSMQFFMIAIIFLIFDVEIIIIIPSIMSMQNSMLIKSMITMNTFITVLIMGIIYEWKNGMIKWF